MRSDLVWKWVDELENPALLDEFEQMTGYRFPEAYRQCILRYNGGYADFPLSGDGEDSVEAVVPLPEPYIDDSVKLNNYNRGEYVWDYMEADYPQEILERYVPFAEASFGNDYCFDKRDSSVVLLDHDLGEAVRIYNSFTDFLNALVPQEEVE